MIYVYFTILIGLFIACGKKNQLEGNDIEINSSAKNKIFLQPPIIEKKFSKILGQHFKSYEGSGVFYKSNVFFIVFDNLNTVGEIDFNLLKGHLAESKKMNSNFEGITFDEKKQKFFIVVESLKNSDGFFPEIIQLDANLKQEKRKLVNFLLKKKNKGFEGVISIHREQKHFLLALCEGNFCYSDKEKHKGNGRIQVLSEKDAEWSVVTEISLPTKANFLDYSDMDIRDHKMIIVSQSSAAVWIGKLSDTNWKIIDEGEVLFFPVRSPKNPTNAKPQISYCNIEGISWISSVQFVAVSDKRNEEQDDFCEEKEQMIHIFNIPNL